MKLTLKINLILRTVKILKFHFDSDDQPVED